jgi:methylated-DNA-protein-cysteine methyltransferase-like protein
VDSARASQILRRVRALPPGRVTTYGDLCPEAPRLAGAVLSGCDDPGVPWQRVVRADGSLAKGERQLGLLREEGTPMRGRRVDMERAWVDVSALSS